MPVTHAHRPGSGRESLAASVGADPYRVLEQLERAGARKAKAEGWAYQLENTTKVLLARIAGEIERDAKDKTSEAKLERLARTDPRYAAHIRQTAEAIHEREAAQADYWRIRAEMQLDEHVMRHIDAMSRLSR